jgi:signal peptidase I
MAIRFLIVIIVAAAVLAAALFGLSKQYTIHSTAMEPAIKADDHVAVFRFSDWFYTPHRNDVVVFETPPLVSRICGTRGALRVIGLPGETVTETIGAVSVDGKRLAETSVKPNRRDHRTGAWHVPKGRYFLMGDNRRERCDSRSFGSVATKRIVGKVYLTFWPVGRVSIG